MVDKVFSPVGGSGCLPARGKTLLIGSLIGFPGALNLMSQSTATRVRGWGGVEEWDEERAGVHGRSLCG